jgi:hypothetical protein
MISFPNCMSDNPTLWFEQLAFEQLETDVFETKKFIEELVEMTNGFRKLLKKVGFTEETHQEAKQVRIKKIVGLNIRKAQKVQKTHANQKKRKVTLHKGD